MENLGAEMPTAAKNRRQKKNTSSTTKPSSSKPKNAEQRLKQKLDEKKQREEEEQEAADKAEAEELKREGNELFKAGDNLGAIECFGAAIDLDPENHVLYSNRSAASLNLLRTRDAVADAEECVDIAPQWSKGYSRLGAALLADKQPEKAVAAYKKGLTIDNESPALKDGYVMAEAAVKELKRKQKEEAETERLEAEAKEANATMNAEPVIGIDLGTTFSCVAWWGPEGVEILTDDDGAKTVPSYVGWNPNGERMIGHRAKANAAKNVKSTIFDVKRIIGQRWGDEAVHKESKNMPFKIYEGAEKKPMIEVETREGELTQFSPEQISAMVLQRMKQIAEKRIGKPCKKAVITVPAYFNDAQRNATKAAGIIAGLDVLRIINEPTAAALAYGLDQSAEGNSAEGKNVLIFDLGGGTFDVSILSIQDGVFEVQATGGDTRLGGEDFDQTLVDHLFQEFKRKQNIEIKSDRDRRKLRAAAERCKRALSSGKSSKVEISIDGEEYSVMVEREKFENLNMTHFNKCMDTVKTVMKDAKVVASEIDDIVLIGGSTRVPMIQQLLSEHFGGRQLCRSINPDEAVAYGAAVQAAILSGVRHSACDDLVLVDVTPLSLGIEVEGRQMSIIIPKNTAIPCKRKDHYTTTENYEETIDCRIFEGERPCTDSNHLLGEFEISGIERAKKGEPDIEVTFSLDSNGILDVSAMDKKTGAQAKTQICNACKSLAPEEIARMVAEAEKFAKQDEEMRRKIDLKTELESGCYDIVDWSESTGKDTHSHTAQECLDWLEGLDVLGCNLASLEQRHREVSKILSELTK